MFRAREGVKKAVSCSAIERRIEMVVPVHCGSHEGIWKNRGDRWHRANGALLAQSRLLSRREGNSSRHDKSDAREAIQRVG